MGLVDTLLAGKADVFSWPGILTPMSGTLLAMISTQPAKMPVPRSIMASRWLTTPNAGTTRPAVIHRLSSKNINSNGSEVSGQSGAIHFRATTHA